MTKFARIDGAGAAIEVCDDVALATHEPILRSTFIGCPDSVKPGDVFFNGAWTDAAPSAPIKSSLPLIAPMALYLAFTPAERIAIKKSTDPMVIEFWDTYTLAARLQNPIDPNLVSVQEALAYLAAPASPGPGAGILASPERVEQIRNGVPL